MRKLRLSILPAVPLVLAASAAQAITIDPSVNTSWSVSYLVPAGSMGDGGITPAAMVINQTFNWFNWGTSLDTLSITTTFENAGFQAAVTNYGFNYDYGGTTSVSLYSYTGALETFRQNVNLPEFGNVDLCVRGSSNGTQCAGGSIQDGLQNGDTSVVELAFTDLGSTPIDFNNFGVMIQTEYGSFHPAGCEGECTPVPEPATLGLLGLGLLGIGIVRRRLSRCEQP